MGSSYRVQAGLELSILLPPLPERWDQRWASLCSAIALFSFTDTWCFVHFLPICLSSSLSLHLIFILTLLHFALHAVFSLPLNSTHERYTLLLSFQRTSVNLVQFSSVHLLEDDCTLFFLQLHRTLLYICTTFSLPTHLLTGTWAGSLICYCRQCCG